MKVLVLILLMVSCNKISAERTSIDGLKCRFTYYPYDKICEGAFPDGTIVRCVAKRIPNAVGFSKPGSSWTATWPEPSAEMKKVLGSLKTKEIRIRTVPVSRFQEETSDPKDILICLDTKNLSRKVLAILRHESSSPHTLAETDCDKIFGYDPSGPPSKRTFDYDCTEGLENDPYPKKYTIKGDES